VWHRSTGPRNLLQKCDQARRVSLDRIVCDGALSSFIAKPLSERRVGDQPT
jgi:hypothetical protein